MNVYEDFRVELDDVSRRLCALIEFAVGYDISTPQGQDEVARAESVADISTWERRRVCLTLGDLAESQIDMVRSVATSLQPRLALFEYVRDRRVAGDAVVAYLRIWREPRTTKQWVEVQFWYGPPTPHHPNTQALESPDARTQS